MVLSNPREIARSTRDVPCTGADDSAEKPEIAACSLVTARPEEKNAGLLGVLMYMARGTDSTPPNP